MLKALLFDLDGTLSDTDPIHYATWRDFMAAYGLDIDPTFYKSHFSGRLNEQILQELLPQLSPAEHAVLSQSKEAEFRDRARTLLQPMPGVLETLHWGNQHGLLRAAVTNAPPKNADFMLETLHLKAAFPLVVLADELPRGKPDPLPYQVALERLGVSAKEAIAFEDSPSGIRSAVSAGIPTVGIASTQTPETLHELGAVLVVDDFTDVRLEAMLRAAVGETAKR